LSKLNKIIENGPGNKAILCALIGQIASGIWFASSIYSEQQEQSRQITELSEKIDSIYEIQQDVAVNSQRLTAIETQLDRVLQGQN